MCVAAHSSFCGSMNVKDLVTEDAAQLKLNGSLCKQLSRHPHTHSFYSVLLEFAVIDRVNYMRDLCKEL